MEVFYRGLIIVYPYGTLIAKKEKIIIVKTKNMPSIINKPLLLIENKLGLGEIQLGSPNKINLKQFSDLHSKHKITELDRKKWWPNYKILFSYPITQIKIYRKPILLEYSTGPQITVTPTNIIVKKIFVGMSGYYYKRMYPAHTRNLLNYYSNILNSVEINSTFYRFPSNSLINNLSNYDLVYSIKVNQLITHRKRVIHIDKVWSEFYQAFHPIHHKINCFLFQFSSKFLFSDENFNRIKHLSTLLNPKHTFAFEFRDKNWFDSEKVIKLFLKHRLVIVILHIAGNWAGNLNPGFNPKLKYWPKTSDSAYFRLHGTTGQYTGSYHAEQLTKIYDFIKSKSLLSSYIYFNNTDESNFALDNAESMTKKFNLINISN